MFRLFLGLVLPILLLVGAARADEQIGSFRLVDDPSVIMLTGEITRNAPLDFRRAAQKRPNARTLVLASRGGLPGEALLVALSVHERGLATFVPRGQSCHAECAYIFLGGVRRNADGEISVSRFEPDAAGAGMPIGESELIDALREFDTPQSLIDRIVRGPASVPYALGPTDLRLLEPGGVAVVDPAPDPDRPSPVQNKPTPPKPGLKGDLTPGGPELDEDEFELDPPVFTPVVPATSVSIAVYEELDFYGRDLSSGYTSNIAECARGCLGDNMCRAFTFNSDPKIKTGPNCFLKSGVGRLEQYRYAISGRVLRSGEQAPQSYSFGAIDPTQDVEQGMRFNGTELSGNVGSSSVGDCRQACIDEELCSGFTYRTSLKQCQLMGSIVSSRQSKGYISGTKRFVTIPVADVIPIAE